LRIRHLKQAHDALVTGGILSVGLRLRSWFSGVFRAVGSSRFNKGVARFFRRQQRSIQKRREKLYHLLNPSAPYLPKPPVPYAEPENPPPLLFDERYYKSQAHGKHSTKLSYWGNYQRYGWKKGFNPHPLFDVKWYLATYPDVAASKEEPFTHFLDKGWQEGYDPNPYFQTDWYIANNPEVLDLSPNPLLHYVEVGWKNGRDPGPKFSIQRYYASSPYMEKLHDPLSEYLEEIEDGNAPDTIRQYVNWPTTYIPSDSEPQPVHPIGKLAVQLHAFYLDKLDLIVEHLKFIPVHFDLLVSTDTESHAREIQEIVAQSGLNCSLDVRCSENRGRDVAPLICLFGRKLLDYDCAMHLHTKKSVTGRVDANLGHQWLMHNLGFLARNEEYVKGILALFSDNPNCGVLAPKPWKGIRRGMKWTSNRQLAETLMERLQLPKTTLNTQPLMFPGGTMFWFRPAALKPLLASDLRFEDFPPEPIPNDGTLAHAIERCILYIALSQGYHSLVIAPSIYKPAS